MLVLYPVRVLAKKHWIIPLSVKRVTITVEERGVNGEREKQDIIFKLKKTAPLLSAGQMSNLVIQEKDADLSDPQKIAQREFIRN